MPRSHDIVIQRDPETRELTRIQTDVTRQRLPEGTDEKTLGSVADKWAAAVVVLAILGGTTLSLSVADFLVSIPHLAEWTKDYAASAVRIDEIGASVGLALDALALGAATRYNQAEQTFQAFTQFLRRDHPQLTQVQPS